MKIFILIFAVIFGLANAQTHRFIYEFKSKQNPKQAEFKKENMTLDINPDDVKFYNYHYVTIDSTNITKGQNSQLWDVSTPVVVRVKNSNTNSNYTLINDVFVFDTEDKINWKLEKETKKFENYTLQKATTTFGGRNWTAWFAKEINISEGPYKFRGLPGIIFQLYDDKNNFDFTLVKSFKLKTTYKTPFIENFYGQKPIKTTQKNIDMMLMNEYKDPYHETREEFKKNPNTTFSINGVDVKDISQFKKLTESRQRYIRENNNPIEIDKAIHYPENKK
ncbi:GLPGLI family protein [Kaistella flava (ex Peng et al. 2021)]|uniref:GLPGLI family protein n=1 Tax=Kaistella flava (ex Peng et al. 2021) TaxID=2038776 RepID=A0A7M2Y900_9FLAO|nr:GLPGLI family protein [Kaistella flava (ex Peng et al. 2021)]QOW09813.1 GLPGLI family protein [Kaistella flava (ex Peng et al. 2021)]